MIILFLYILIIISINVICIITSSWHIHLILNKNVNLITLSDHSPAVEESKMKWDLWFWHKRAITIAEAVDDRLYQSMAHTEHNGKYIGHSWVHRLIVSCVSWEDLWKF